MTRRLLLLVLLSMLLVSCSAGTPAQTPALTISAAPLPAGTASVPGSTPQADLPPQETVSSVYAYEYLPQLFSCITTRTQTGGGQFVDTALVYGVFDSYAGADYWMSAFLVDQPFYYTDHFLCDEGWFTRFSDAQSEVPVFEMPLELYEGLCFDGKDGPCEVIAVDETVSVGTQEFADALLIAVDSVQHGAQVFEIYQRGIGLAARYIEYGADCYEMLAQVIDVQIWDEAQVRELIENTVF